MKKLLAMVMCVCLAVMFTACGKGKDQTDSEYVKEKGKLVIGITDYAPMDYKKTEGSGEWIGFDADMAKAFAKELGVSVHHYITDKRLLKAHLLLLSGASAGEACAASGFGEYSSFFRLYKKRYGKTPSACK